MDEIQCDYKGVLKGVIKVSYHAATRIPPGLECLDRVTPTISRPLLLLRSTFD